MGLSVAPCPGALGATVTGIDLGEIDQATTQTLREALLAHQVLFFPAAGLGPDAQVRFGQAFGLLERHAVLDALEDHPEVVVFDTAAKATVAEWWHTDVTCAPEPPMGAILQMVIAPPSGGDTHWASMTAAYDALDDSLKADIEGLHALHRSWWTPTQESIHPVVRIHPETGRRALFVNGIFTKRIVELDQKAGDELLRALCEHAIADEFTVRHRWQSGDIAFWDNRCTQHRVDNDFGTARRRGHRISVIGDRPLQVSAA